MTWKPQDTWVEVDLEAIASNFKAVQQLIGPEIAVMAVVKANGYGHGFIEPSIRLIKAGASALAVSRLGEAIALREAGITAPILVFTPLFDDELSEAISRDISITVTRKSAVAKTTEVAVQMQKTARIHIKVDTGMSRLGALPVEVNDMLGMAHMCQYVQVDGIYSHFATAAEVSESGCKKQLDKFTYMLSNLTHPLSAQTKTHIANSAALFRLPESRLDMVRVGTLLFGQCSAPECKNQLNLKPTWSFKARVCEVKLLPTGCSVGYGADVKTKRPTRTAVVPVGYADGFTMMPSGPFYRQSLIRLIAKKANGRMHVQYLEKEIPVLGRVAMQFTVLDVTDFPDIQLGSVVEIPALRIPTSALVPRIYTKQPRVSG